MEGREFYIVNTALGGFFDELEKLGFDPFGPGDIRGTQMQSVGGGAKLPTPKVNLRSRQLAVKGAPKPGPASQTFSGPTPGRGKRVTIRRQTKVGPSPEPVHKPGAFPPGAAAKGSGSAIPAPITPQA